MNKVLLAVIILLMARTAFAEVEEGSKLLVNTSKIVVEKGAIVEEAFGTRQYYTAKEVIPYYIDADKVTFKDLCINKVEITRENLIVDRDRAQLIVNDCNTLLLKMDEADLVVPVEIVK